MLVSATASAIFLFLTSFNLGITRKFYIEFNSDFTDGTPAFDDGNSFQAHKFVQV